MANKTKLVQSLNYSIVRVNVEARGAHDAWMFKYLERGEVSLTGRKPTQEECWEEIRNRQES